MKTKSETVMDLIEAKAGVSQNPEAMVPAPSSLPEFFINTDTSPFHQPVKKPVWMFADHELLPVQKIGGVAVENMAYPVSIAWINNGKSLLQLHVAGLN